MIRKLLSDLCLKLIEEGNNLFFFEHFGDDLAVSVACLEREIDLCDCGLTNSESVGNCAMWVAFEEHIGNGEAFGQHKTFDGGEEVREETRGDTGARVKGE